MPVISMDPAELARLYGGELSLEILRERIPMLGADPDHIAADGLEIEFFPDRPDLYSVEGVARALRTFLSDDPHPQRYATEPPTTTFTVDGNLAKIRPFAVGAMVSGITIDASLLEGIINIQEKLTLTTGRKRAKVAIGIHDARDLLGPFLYKGHAPDALSFIPLHSEEEMTLAEILVEHDKGREYAHLIQDAAVYPVITDINDHILSFPPIINGALTTVTTATRELFLDLTGTDLVTLQACLGILCCMFIDRGAAVRQVTMVYPDREFVTPVLDHEPMVVPFSAFTRLLGRVSPEQCVLGLQRMGFPAYHEGDNLHVEVPPYRSDILHPVDIVEDAAIGIGYGNLPPELPKVVTYAGRRAIDGLADRSRTILVGHGYQEVTTLTLSSADQQFARLGLDEEEAVTVTNPITRDHTLLRVRLLPSLLSLLQANQHRELPQRIFETGVVVRAARNQTHLAGLSLHAKAHFTEMRSLQDALLRDLGVDGQISAYASPIYVPGRAARVMVGETMLGHFGEVHPARLEAFELGHPLVAFEWDLQVLMALTNRSRGDRPADDPSE